MANPAEYSWHRRAQAVIAGNYLSEEKSPEAFGLEHYPTHAVKGEGCFFYDHKGKKYLDFTSGGGTNLFGYGHIKIWAALEGQLRRGFTYPISSTHEVDAAEKLQELIPFAESVKWCATEGEAKIEAYGLAASATGKDPLIIEPIVGDMSEPHIEYLAKLRSECDRDGRLLVFDETHTGVRFQRFSAATFTGITPDLILLGGPLANGLRIAAIAGKQKVMAFTEKTSDEFAGEAMPLVAAKTVMALLQTTADISWLWANGNRFIEQFNAIWPEGIQLVGLPVSPTFKGSHEVCTAFARECVKAGIFLGQRVWWNFPLIDEWQNALVSMRAILVRMQSGAVK